MKNMSKMLKQAQQLQAKMADMQEKLQSKTVEATAGGGMVTVVATCGQQIESIRIKPEVVNGDDVEMLEDLVTAAVNEALRKAQETAAAEMAKLTGGLNIPGLM